MAGYNGGDQSTEINAAVWVLISISTLFLATRLWCRQHFSQISWDDLVLIISWLLLLIAGALVSCTIAVVYDQTDDARRAFFRYQNTSTWLAAVATSWTKVAFAITLTRIVQERILKYFLWFIIAVANLILIPGALSIWIPACGDPRAIYRPAYPKCLELRVLQYLGGSFLGSGGVIDVLLALLPWFVLRNLLLEKREKIGLTIAMSLGAITGVIVILRTFFQFVQGDYNYNYIVFMLLFNFLEPVATIIAQTIPIFRVLLVRRVRRATQKSKTSDTLTVLSTMAEADVTSLPIMPLDTADMPTPPIDDDSATNLDDDFLVMSHNRRQQVNLFRDKICHARDEEKYKLAHKFGTSCSFNTPDCSSFSLSVIASY
ncbi:uncharacterized protein DNG_00046 [Cephalotrichum gorgonifer]|uniref:Rhodopsin domain-containing protein n=1 Tax=Cephalotrichum gorgonifer TaxID=2041049 RepID=A0AAE8SQJ5_9PEZI|nr:uncharacterized protein DNG_00046 [Cephalotrichum gorgonifer]